MVKHTPATPLPWEQDPTGDCGPEWVGTSDVDYFVVDATEHAADAAYIAHAANVYPGAIENIRALLWALRQADAGRFKETERQAEKFLRELGEAE